MKKMTIGVLTAVLAVLVSACGSTPTSPSCATVASCQAQESSTPTGVAPSVTASVTAQIWLGTSDTPGPTPARNEDGSYAVPVGQWFKVRYQVSNPQADGRTIAYGLNSLVSGDRPWSDNFMEPSRPAEVHGFDMTACNQAGRVLTSTLSGSETGGNLPAAVALSSSVTVRCQ